MTSCQLYVITMANFNIRNVLDRTELAVEIQRFTKYIETIYLSFNDVWIQTFVERHGIVYDADDFNVEAAGGEDGKLVIVNKIYRLPNVAC
jgi:hypothetical protein